MTEWAKRKNVWISKDPVAPGIWRRRDGGYYVRARAIDERTSQEVEAVATLPGASLAEAREALERLRHELRAGAPRSSPRKPRFYEYATSLLERRIVGGQVKSATTKRKWADALTLHLIPFFGEMFVDKIRAEDVEAWKAAASQATYSTARKRRDAPVRKGKLKPERVLAYAPTSKNTWLAILRDVLTAATDEFGLPVNPMARVQPFDESDHRPYTEEAPNALTPAEAARFLAAMRELCPQHYAMTALGFATGLRPSSLRPLRRRGPSPDVLWSQGALLVRRSQTKGEAMAKTKTARDQRVYLPAEMVELLRAHVAALPSGPMQTSDLLFPSETGGFRSRSALDKPFAAVCAKLKLAKKITPRGMRRTYQDLMRAAGVDRVVKRSISGHATETMEEHYSTVNPAEQRASITRLLTLVGVGVGTLTTGGTPPPGDLGGGTHDGTHSLDVN